VLVERHQFDPKKHEAYVANTLERLGNPVIDDQVARVGRQPLRKLSRNERLVGPAAYFAELGQEPKAILEVVFAALLFRDDGDSEVLELAEIIETQSVADCVAKICGIDPSHPLYPSLLEVFSLHKSALNRA
jgi:mannitol-1-phosphate 5-dehydrogenase